MTPAFEAAFEGAGAPSICCTCGRTNYARGSDQERSPGRFALHDGDSVYAKLIAGNPYVVGCPCGWVEKFEALLWAERSRIARYLRERAQREAAEALGTAIELEKVLT